MRHPLDQPATPDALRTLFYQGLVSRNALDASMRAIGVRRSWRQHSSALLLVLGAGLVLSGVIFWIANNWAYLEHSAKLVGVQVLVAGCALGACWRGTQRIEGRALMFAACVLVGAYLAVFGQIYQTGADVWELFRGWSLLIALWVVAARVPELWLLLLAVVHAALSLYFDQVLFYRWQQESWAWLALAGVHALGLVGFEVVRRGTYFRSHPSWPRHGLVPIVLMLLCLPVTMVIFDDRYERASSWVALGALTASAVLGYRFYRHVERSLFPLTCIGFACAWLVTALALRVLVVSNGECTGMVLAGLLIVAMLGWLVRWVRRLNIEMRQEVNHG